MNTVTEQQQENLRALADYLRSGTLSVPFSMRHYYHDGEHNIGPVQALKQTAQAQQQSTACALGQSLSVASLPAPDKQSKSWGTYGKVVFGVEPYTIGWDFLFSGNWERQDNTAVGAAERIDYFLTHAAHRPRRAHYAVLGPVSV